MGKVDHTLGLVIWHVGRGQISLNTSVGSSWFPPTGRGVDYNLKWVEGTQ